LSPVEKIGGGHTRIAHYLVAHDLSPPAPADYSAVIGRIVWLWASLRAADLNLAAELVRRLPSVAVRSSPSGTAPLAQDAGERRKLCAIGSSRTAGTAPL
jgi:hypothetical protein